jgi:hypothetical protein
MKTEEKQPQCEEKKERKESSAHKQRGEDNKLKKVISLCD